MSDFSDEQLQVICEAAAVLACECPTHLVDLFRRVRLKSDTPSKAGGLMSVTAPRADVLAQGCLSRLELTAVVSRFLFSDVATYCF
jgi:hypothetical protein